MEPTETEIVPEAAVAAAAAPEQLEPVAPGATPEPPPAAPPPYIRSFGQMIREYLADVPTFGAAVVPLCFLSIALFTRHPTKTNFIFDEQEALLANPYVRSVADPASKIRWIDAFHRDFWGLLPDRSIGSYRPLPDLIWRALWALGARDQTPFLHHWVNVLLHGVNGALLVTLVYKLTGRNRLAWLTGALFVACAVSTEAVTGVVGIADVLGGLGCLFGLHALFCELAWLPLAVFGATMFGLLSKESCLCMVPLVPFAAYCWSGKTHPERPRAWTRAIVALIAASAAFVLYVEARRRLFPAPLPAEISAAANQGKSGAARAFAAILRWYAQPTLPHDPLNNPLINATPSFRVAGALRVYWRGIGQILFPAVLSGDYSAPSEPIPAHLIFPESVLGALALIVPALVAIGIALFVPSARKPAIVLGRRTEDDDRSLVAVGFLWVLISYFPVSNIPILLPTVRAERFWYVPAIGTSLLLGVAFDHLIKWAHVRRKEFPVFMSITIFFSFQAFAARRHANDYRDDLVFWDATRHAVPTSAKAQLNYSVMLGTRNDLPGRLVANREALKLAPEWPMASIYEGDTLCRMDRPDEAWPDYKRGFELAPNDKNLIALALQCLWDKKALAAENPIRDELETVGNAHPGTWLENLSRDILTNGDKLNGVDPKNRPRAYNEGPKGD